MIKITQDCISEVVDDYLQTPTEPLNDDKTEIMLIPPKKQTNKQTNKTKNKNKKQKNNNYAILLYSLSLCL